MSAAWTEDRLLALADEIRDRMESLRAQGITADTEGLCRRDRLATLLNARLDRLRAQRGGNVIDAAHRFAAAGEPADACEALLRRNNRDLPEPELQALLLRHEELFDAEPAA